jgi:transcriptional regulator with XRE-family HTH domain
MTRLPFTRRRILSTHDPLVTPATTSVSIRVRERRHALGLSQSGLAELAGVSPELVSRIERGRCLPSLPTLVTFANVLRTTPNDLLGFEQPLADAEIRPLIDAVNALGPAQRDELRRIAEALAKYQQDAPGGRSGGRARPESGFTSAPATDEDAGEEELG